MLYGKKFVQLYSVHSPSVEIRFWFKFETVNACNLFNLFKVIYKASVCTPNGKTMSYYGCCETDFKASYYNHKQSFKTSSKRQQTELSKTCLATQR